MRLLWLLSTMSLFAFSPCNRTAAYNLHVTRRCTRSAEMREAVSGAGRDCSLYSRVENTSRGIKFIAGHTKMSPHQSVITVVSKQARGNRKKEHRSTRNNRQGRGGYLIRRWCALFVFPPFSFLAWREELRVLGSWQRRPHRQEARVQELLATVALPYRAQVETQRSYAPAELVQ